MAHRNSTAPSSEACPYRSQLGGGCPAGVSHRAVAASHSRACERSKESQTGGEEPRESLMKNRIASSRAPGSLEVDGEGKAAECPAPPGAQEMQGLGEREAGEAGIHGESGGGAAAAPRCPLGYDSGASFKIGPLSCVLCRALLYESSRCVPCNHVYCKACILRFSDCPLCGADIESLRSDPDIQSLVDKFIDGHARSSRAGLERGANQTASTHSPSSSLASSLSPPVGHSLPSPMKDEDGVVAGGEGYLLHQAMLAFVGQNYESARNRLLICLEDARSELACTSATERAVSPGPIGRLGAVLGFLGDATRLLGEEQEALRYYEESVRVLSGTDVHNGNDSELVHALAVSHNKIGDLHYRANDLERAAKSYREGLRVRQEAAVRKGRRTHEVTESGGEGMQLTSPSLAVDIAVSLAKVADVERALGNEEAAVRGFLEAKEMVERLNFGVAGDREGPLSRGEEKAMALDRQRVSLISFLSTAIKESPNDEAPTV